MASSATYDPSQLHSVSGLVAVVTGGGSGLGLIVAKTLEHNGATVYITGRRRERLEEAARQAARGNIIPIAGSTCDHDDLQRAVDVVSRQSGHVDLLVCNAGQTTVDRRADARPKPTADRNTLREIRDYYFHHRPAAVWSDTLNTNVAAVFTTTMAFLELLDAANQRRPAGAPTSQVVAMGSTGGLIKSTDSFIYNASKAAVHHLMKNLGHFLVPFDIRTNIIAPGWFPTDMTTPVVQAWKHTHGVMPRTLVPAQRMGREEELAGTVLYLAGRAGAYCNGSIMVIDGGVTATHPSTY